MKSNCLIIYVALTLVFGFSASAQSYSIDRSVFSGGGGTSTNGQYSLVGTIGQADASPTISGEQYSLIGGFWSLVSVMQTPGAPMLTIHRTGNQITISWPTPSSVWKLQQNPNLANTSGWSASGYSVSTNNGVSSITLTGPVGNLFFRLSQ